MARSHFQFKKRQKELDKKKKKEDKKQSKLEDKAVKIDQTETEPTPSTEDQQVQEQTGANILSTSAAV